MDIDDYGALGDGRSVALSGIDGSIDWWCVPNMDSMPLFDRLLEPEEGGCFIIRPRGQFEVLRRYKPGSNVLETEFVTATGRARMTESLNSGHAGRLPWAELARRVEGLEGKVTFDVQMTIGRRAGTVSPYMSEIGGRQVFHAGRVLGLFLKSGGVSVKLSDAGVAGSMTVRAGDREIMGIVAGEDEPLVVPSIDEIDGRIDGSDQAWRTWSQNLRYDGEHREAFVRSALVLKLLLYSPSGAVAAAATTSLPEGIGGAKNYDYRYAWVRDAGYTINAFLAAGAEAEAKAAFSWLVARLKAHGSCVCFTLAGELVDNVREFDFAGYRGSKPVVVGNLATGQQQHGVYGDIFETASRFVSRGNILDSATAELLSHLADECADLWRSPDSGIWELPEVRHYTMSKISCWQALTRAVQLADSGQLPTTCRERWHREAGRIAEWIDANCWSNEKGAFVMFPGSNRLDASLALAVRFGFDGRDKLVATMEAIDRELGAGSFHYRYSGAEQEEGCFIACSFWVAEAWAMLGNPKRAGERLEDLQQALARDSGLYAEMVDPETKTFLGNLPQGLSHLAHLMALSTLNDGGRDTKRNSAAR
ncbi:glycoside hydrolase family 15 protein [Agrobacterium tumefaciens]|uniref:Glycoside hydrolase family 15 protein n=1 Tax=Agrobacterium tumefaciens TaxID=358 RepID=A0AA44F6N3_AGRTU|nr:glycoside hydrolase family 15 protein [Agrobacterium tumefaciens]NTC29688.1 glycoside hydrolase family 15 protein [Agrobacterium tumefaciens]